LDPVTHLLTGACMGRAGFNRKTALATLTMTLAAEAADGDLLWAVKGPVAAFQHHRGISHSFVGAPLVAAATLGFVYLLERYWLSKRKHRDGGPRVRWLYLYGLALLAALSHLLLDYTTSYGTRLFEPFNYRWYSWDIMFIIEPVMLAMLLLGLVMPSLFGLINQEIGARSKGARGRGWAIAALIGVVLLWGYRDYQHRRALNAVSSVMYNGPEPQRVAAYPYSVNPYRWLGVVETRNFFQTVPVDSRTPQVDPKSEARTFYKPEETPVTEAAKAASFGRVFLDWAAFPYVETQTFEGEPRGELVSFQDLRYAYPERRGTLAGFVFLNPKLQVEAQGPNSSRPDWLRELQGVSSK
jgi:inner membrane protein